MNGHSWGALLAPPKQQGALVAMALGARAIHPKEELGGVRTLAHPSQAAARKAQDLVAPRRAWRSGVAAKPRRGVAQATSAWLPGGSWV